MSTGSGVATMDNYSAGEVGGIFAGVVAVLGLIGGGLKWLVGWRDKKLKAWELSLDRREKNLRLKTEARLGVLEEQVAVLGRAFHDTRGVLLEVTIDLREHDPASPALAKAEAQLRRRYAVPAPAPIAGDLPDDLTDLVGRLDQYE